MLHTMGTVITLASRIHSVSMSACSPWGMAGSGSLDSSGCSFTESCTGTTGCQRQPGAPGARAASAAYSCIMCAAGVHWRGAGSVCILFMLRESWQGRGVQRSLRGACLADLCRNDAKVKASQDQGQGDAGHHEQRPRSCQLARWQWRQCLRCMTSSATEGLSARAGDSAWQAAHAQPETQLLRHPAQQLGCWPATAPEVFDLHPCIVRQPVLRRCMLACMHVSTCIPSAAVCTGRHEVQHGLQLVSSEHLLGP